MNKLTIYILSVALLLLNACGIYSLSGAQIDAKTIQIAYFPNQAALVEPSLSQEFTLALQDMYLRQTNLELVKSGGELQLEGEIKDYQIRPAAATANQTAAFNRLTIKVNVRFFNTLNESESFERVFSFYHDFPADKQLTGSVKEEAFQDIFERITQDIFNATVANW
jgi:ASC-1-like (ASCH) protein